MEVVMRNERQVIGDCRQYLLKYELVSHRFPEEEGRGFYYGIRIYQYHHIERDGEPELYDYCEVPGFSESLGETKVFFGKIYEGNATPVSLFYIVDDWKCAFNEE